MYVCLCNCVTDRQIRTAVRNGVVTFAQLRMETGVSTCCGRCTPCARQVLTEALDESLPVLPTRVQLPAIA